MESIVIDPIDGPHTATLVLLHGLGDVAHLFAHGWQGMARTFAAEIPYMKVIMPYAPVQSVAINHGRRMPAWYDMVSLDDRNRDSCNGIDESIKRISRIIDNEVLAGIPRSRIILGGLSQGGATALYMGYHMQEPLAGIVALSAYLPDLSNYMVEEGAKTMQFIMCHGERDKTVQLSWGQDSFDFLDQQGVPGLFSVYPDVAHFVDDEEIDEVVAWLQARLPAI